MFNIDFVLIIEYIELYKLFKLIGVVDSGGVGKVVVVDGVVMVDGQLELCKIVKICVGQVVMFGDVCIVVQGVDQCFRCLKMYFVLGCVIFIFIYIQEIDYVDCFLVCFGGSGVVDCVCWYC